MESNFVFESCGDMRLQPGKHLATASITYKPTGETFVSMQMEGETEEQWKLRALAVVKDRLGYIEL